MIKLSLSKKVLFLFCFYNISAFAQISPLPEEESGIKRPLQKLMPSFYPDIKKPVKSFTWVLDKDTMARHVYDKAGNEIQTINYSNNKPGAQVLVTYTNGLKTSSGYWGNGIQQRGSTFKYNANKNLVEWTSVDYRYDKQTQKTTTANERHWMVEWIDSKRMKSRYILDAGKTKSALSEYTYNESGKLSEINMQQWKTTYDYNDGLLVRKTKLFKNDGSITESFDYSYNADGQMTRSASKYGIETYSYEAGKLKKMRVMKASDTTQYQDAEFLYKGNVLSTVNIRYNDIQMVYSTPAFNMLSDKLLAGWKSKQENLVTMELVYDKRGNITEIRYSVNGQYQYSQRFLYTYY